MYPLHTILNTLNVYYCNQLIYCWKSGANLCQTLVTKIKMLSCLAAFFSDLTQGVNDVIGNLITDCLDCLNISLCMYFFVSNQTQAHHYLNHIIQNGCHGFLLLCSQFPFYQALSLFYSTSPLHYFTSTNYTGKKFYCLIISNH